MAEKKMVPMWSIFDRTPEGRGKDWGPPLLPVSFAQLAHRPVNRYSRPVTQI